MMRTANCVDRLTSDDGPSVGKLRTESYRRLFGESVNEKALQWNQQDEHFINIGLFQDHQLVSVMRVAHVHDEVTFNNVLLYKFDSNQFTLPVTILGRAATLEQFESMRFHTYLRYHALELARAAGAKWVLGTLKKDSKRIRQLVDLGYDLISNPAPWDRFLKSQESTYVVRLNVDKSIDRACTKIREATKDHFLKFPISYDVDSIVRHMNRGSKSK